MFVENTPVPVSDEAGNTIYVRPKMGKGLEAQVSAEFGRLGGRNQIAYEFCLLAFNIVKWEGPDFVDGNGKPIPVTRANIDRLDPHEPLVSQVIARIVELNTRSVVDAAVPPDAEADPTPAAALT